MADELGQQENIEAVQGTLETRADAGKGESGKHKFWMQAIELATKEESTWVKRASQTIDIYRDATDRRKKRYNILYANTEVMSQAVYNSRAVPDVRSRYREQDPINQAVALILERALEYATDDSEHDFDQVIKGNVKDVLLPGRCVARVRYKPHFQTRNHRIAVIPGPNGTMQRVDTGAYLDPNTEPKTDDQGPYIDGDSYEQITYEECYVEHVQWADFRRGPGKVWDDVPWIGFRHYLTKDQVIELNKDLGAKIPMDSTVNQDGKYQSADNGTAPSPTIFKRLCVWEIWDKEKRKVIWLAPSWKTDLLREDDDPLNLAQFFPIPRPILAVEVPETLVPVEPYRLYKDNADELDTLSRRLTALTRACKWHGVYAATEGGTTFTTLQDANDGDFIPAQEFASVAATGGDMGKFIWTRDIKMGAETIRLLSERQEIVKRQIYEVMGIADILRGNTESRETATTSRVKAQWGSIRLQHLQQEVQRYIRDIFRLMAEVIAEKYQRETLQLITGLTVPDQVMEVLRSDALRCFRVDIETDSTIQADLQRWQENATQFVGGMAQLMGALGPAVEAQVIPAQAGIEIVKGFASMFKLPRRVTQALEGLQAPPPQQPDQGEQVRAQAEIEKAKADIQKTQIEGQNVQLEAQAKRAEIAASTQAQQQKHGMEMQKMGAQFQTDMAKIAAQRVAAQQRNVVPMKGAQK